MYDFKFIGIDLDLIDRIYFHSAADRTEFLTEIQSTLSQLSIRIGDNRLEIINKIADANVAFEFLSDVLAFTGDLQYSKKSDRNNYYTNCKLCEYNLVKKLKYGENDFRNEEVLFHSLILIDLSGYAKANLIFNMGHTFAQLNLWEKADFYFDVLRSDIFELSPVTVSDFYRRIAEVYLVSGFKNTALIWLKRGVRLNSKLAVKKIIKQLESK